MLDTCWRYTVFVSIAIVISSGLLHIDSGQKVGSHSRILSLPCLPHSMKYQTLILLWLHETISSSRAVLSSPVTWHSYSLQQFYKQPYLVTFQVYWHRLFDTPSCISLCHQDHHDLCHHLNSSEDLESSLWCSFCLFLGTLFGCLSDHTACPLKYLQDSMHSHFLDVVPFFPLAPVPFTSLP